MTLVELHWRRKKNGVPILSKKDIDNIAEVILTDYKPALLKEPMPIAIDGFAEFYMGIKMDYQDLSHNRSILGMMIFSDCNLTVYDKENNDVKVIPVNEGTALIDNSLLEKSQKLRERFTVGHEIGHWIFHRRIFRDNKRQLKFDFGMEEEQSVIQCLKKDIENSAGMRSFTTDKGWMEWQADCMSSALLMPKKSFGVAVQEIFKQAGIKEGFITKGVDPDLDLFTEAINESLAGIFNVSILAAKIRVEKLGYIKEKSSGMQLQLF